MSNVLEISNLHKIFGETSVLKNIHLTLQKGEMLVMVGPSGCGKSTLLNIIAGLENPSNGELAIGGRSMLNVPPKDRDIAMVFQSYALYPSMNVKKNITFGMRMRGRSQKEQDQAAMEVSRLLHIDHLMERKPSQLSGGQRQRVAMGRALVREPVLFLFDEPLSNLDAKLRIEMRAEIKKIHQRLGASMVYVTHDQLEAMNLADRIAVMHHGEIIQIGPPQEVYDKPKNTFVADFIGSPSINLIKGTLGGDSKNPTFLPQNTSQQSPWKLSSKQISSSWTNNQTVILGLRPEHISSEPTQSPYDQTLSLTPQIIETNGFDIYGRFEFQQQDICGRFPPHFPLKINQPTELHLDLSYASIFLQETGECL